MISLHAILLLNDMPCRKWVSFATRQNLYNGAYTTIQSFRNVQNTYYKKEKIWQTYH